MLSVSVLLVSDAVLLLQEHPAWVLAFKQKLGSIQCDCLFVVFSLMRDSVKDSCVQLLLAQWMASKSIVERDKEAVKGQTMELFKTQ
jgi:hypothetical protein